MYFTHNHDGNYAFVLCCPAPGVLRVPPGCSFTGPKALAKAAGRAQQLQAAHGTEPVPQHVDSEGDRLGAAYSRERDPARKAILKAAWLNQIRIECGMPAKARPALEVFEGIEWTKGAAA